jgi:hypothetical protein
VTKRRTKTKSVNLRRKFKEQREILDHVDHVRGKTPASKYVIDTLRDVYCLNDTTPKSESQ